MILGDLSDTKRVEALHPLLGKLFSYIKEHDFLSDPIGRIELDGDRVYIDVTSMCMSLLMLLK